MQDDVTEYMESLDVPAPVRERTTILLRRYDALGVGRGRAFLSEASDEDGSRQYRSLWIFTPSAVMEAELRDEDTAEMDAVRLPGNLTRLVVRVRAFDFQPATAESRLSVDLWFSDEILGQLEASGANCDRLATLLRDYVVPAIVPD